MQTRFDEFLEFPCQFPYKVVGIAREDLMDDVLRTVQNLIPGDYAPSQKTSSKGTYFSVSISVRVENKAQIEQLYQALATIEGVRRVL